MRRTRFLRSTTSGFTLTETLLMAVTLSLALTGALAVSSVSLRAADKTATETGLTGSSRLAMDEVLYHVRGADQVLASGVFGGVTQTTGASQVLLDAPGYDPATAAFYLDSVRDIILLRYDAQNKRLLETLVPGTGSVRPARTDYVLAQNVAGCTFTYSVREGFSSGATGNATFTLGAVPLTTPTAYVNGVLTPCTFDAVHQTATVSLTARPSDVQFVYPIDPAAGSGTLALVGEVSVVLQMQDTDHRQIARVMTLQGGARLRNWRN